MTDADAARGARWATRPITFVGSLVVLSAVYLSSPSGIGGLALVGTAVGGIACFAVGPLVHRPSNRRPWHWLTAAGALFLTGLLLRFELVVVPGLLGSADLWAFLGYACTAWFLRGLLRQTESGRDRALWLDTAAITSGSALIGWVMNIAPQLSRSDRQFGQTLVNTLYPVMDAMLLALTVQLAFRRGSSAPALRAAVAGLSAMLAGDLAYTFVWAADPGAVNPYVNVLYLIAYASIGLMAAHPSMRELSDVDVRYTPATSRGRLVMIFLVMVTPATVPIMLPTHGPLDSAVRAVIMAVFGGVVFLRLLLTIRALRRAEAEAQLRATHDVLTGLPNRVALLDDLREHLDQLHARERSGWVDVLLLDCDQFKQVNDSWGHAAGDEVLVEFAKRLRSVTAADGYVTRVGGDEFVLRIDSDEREEASATAGLILEAFQTPLTISDDRTTLLVPSIGIAQASQASPVTAEEMLRNADIALYEAKDAGGASFAVYDSSMHDRIVRRHQLADSLRTALANGEISVVFQPIRSGAGYSVLAGWEALARWDHPELGSVSPFEFIPIAEDTGLIVDIGTFILRRACDQLRRWQDRYRRGDLHVAVNISSVQLRRDDVVALVGGVLEETGLTAGSLWLEITESVVLERTEEALRVLRGLNTLGVTLCMDDFGTGYSSLSYLKDFAVNILKIDRTFIRTLAEDPRDRELAKAMVNVAAALRLDGVVAEGVETQDQATILEALGCSLAQGYLYGKPVPPEDATRAADELLLAPTGASTLRVAPGTTTPGLPRQRSATASDGSPDRASRGR